MDVWEKAKIISAILAAVGIPLVIATLEIFIQKRSRNENFRVSSSSLQYKY